MTVYSRFFKLYLYTALAPVPIAAFGLSLIHIWPFECVSAGPYRVTPLPAKHMDTEQALFYLIEREGRSLLYAHDTGRFYPEAVSYTHLMLRQKHGIREGSRLASMLIYLATGLCCIVTAVSYTHLLDLALVVFSARSPPVFQFCSERIAS